MYKKNSFSFMAVTEPSQLSRASPVDATESNSSKKDIRYLRANSLVKQGAGKKLAF
jgi:hypothetical protein